MQKIDADHRCQVFQIWPWGVNDVEIERIRHSIGQSAVTDPGIDAGAMVRIRITGLPDDAWKSLLKLHGVFSAAAGQFKHGASSWKGFLKNSGNHFTVSGCCRKQKPQIASRTVSEKCRAGGAQVP